MSGIAGYWGYGGAELDAAAFAAFTHSQAHRGPDGEGIEHIAPERLWLGHQCLALFERAAPERQPIASGEGRFRLIFDGEIYNGAELRAELGGFGHRFLAESDAELVLAAYAQWGKDCLPRFNGIWAFALWDARARRLVLARDRFGIKPLHYCIRNGAIAFASELKAFLALPWIDGALDPAILAEAFADIDGQGAALDTLLPGVKRLQAGRAMSVDAAGTIETEYWWNTLDHLPQPPQDLRAQTEEFRALFFDACRLRLRGDAPLATEQSGGVDSSAIACTFAELDRSGALDHPPRDRRRAFIACFTGTPYDERELARRVVEHTGMAPNYLDIDGSQALGCIEKVIFDHEILFKFPRVGSWLVYRAMREAGVRISLNGMGVDDLLGSEGEDVQAGLDAAAARGDTARYRELSVILAGLNGRDVAIDRAGPSDALRWFLLRELRRFKLIEPLRDARAQARSLTARLRRFIRSGDLAALRPAPALLAPQAGFHHGPDDAMAARAAGLSPLEAKRFTDFHIGNVTYLANFDRAAMAHGIQTRMPFMDWRIVTYGFALPDAARNAGGYTKRVLRLAMEGLMPDSVRLLRRKMAFVSPLDAWARGALKPWLLDLSSSRSFIESAAWNGRAARTIVERATAGQASLQPVWPLLHAYALERGFKAAAAQHRANASPHGVETRAREAHSGAGPE